MCENEEAGTGVTLMKTKSSGAGSGATFIKRRAPEQELCHFYDGSTALKESDFLTSKKIKYVTNFVF